MNETIKIKKLEEAKAKGIDLITAHTRQGMLSTGLTEWHLRKTLNYKTQIGSMFCGDRLEDEVRGVNYYDTILNDPLKTFSNGDSLIDMVCTDCLEKI